MPLPAIIGGAALAARFAGPLARFGGRLLGGRLGIGITGGVIAGRAIAGRVASNRGAQLALGAGGAGAVGASLARGGAGAMFPAPEIAYGWNTGTAQFYRLTDGRITVQRRDGTWKAPYRPYRPVCIPKKWNARSMSRVQTALKRQRKTALAIGRMTGGLPKR